MKKNCASRISCIFLLKLCFIISFLFSQEISVSQVAREPFKQNMCASGLDIPDGMFPIEEVILLEVPDKYKSHPEYGKTKLSNPDQQNSYELIHERTIDSRLFQNPDGSFTAVKSGEPMHYKDADGWWRTIEVKFEEDDLKPHLYHLRRQRLPISFDGKTGAITMQLDHANSMSYGKNLKFIQVGNNGQILSEKNTNNFTASVDLNKAKATANQIFNGIDMSTDFDFWMAKTNYTLFSPSQISSQAKWVVFREEVSIPTGWTMDYDLTSGAYVEANWQGNVVIKNPSGEIKSSFQTPIYFDSGNDRNTNNITGLYKLEQINSTTYHLYVMVPANWLLSPQRIYPVTIDPVAFVDDPTIFASCFYPEYEESTLSATIPSGCLISNTNLLWEFTAINNNGWMEDQRSYVSSVNGQTTVFYGTGPSAGTQTYSTNTPIGNSTSMGSVNYSFFASRIWGGTGCNTTYNYINRRRLEVTYNCTVSVNNVDKDVSIFYNPIEKSIEIVNLKDYVAIFACDIIGRNIPLTIKNQNHTDYSMHLSSYKSQYVIMKIITSKDIMTKKLLVY